jgi:hypothetical protein
MSSQILKQRKTPSDLDTESQAAGTYRVICVEVDEGDRRPIILP